MAGWLGRGHPALLEAFEDVCGRIDREVRAELLSKKPRRRDASTSTADEDFMNDQLVVIDRLRKENERLRSELAALTAVKDRVRLPRSSRAASASEDSIFIAPSTPSEAPDTGHSELAVLQLKYVALNSNFKIAREGLARRKKERDDSMRREASLMSRIRAAEEQYGIQILSKGASDAPIGPGAASDDEALDLSSSPGQNAALTGDPSALDNDALQSTQGDPDEENLELPPLQAEDGSAQIMVKQEPSSDTPVIVSERILKRKRIRDDAPGPDDFHGIKDEPDNATIIAVCERMVSQTQESLDLDNIAQRMTTPRKRRQAEDARRQHSAGWGHSLLTPVPSSARLENPLLDTRGESSRVQAATSILTPVSGNERMTRFVSEADKTPSMRHGLNRGIEALAEDGEIFARGESSRRHHKLGAPLTVEKGQGRVRRLLSDSTTRNGDESKAAVERVPAASQSQLEVPERRELPFDQATRVKRKDPLPHAPPNATGLDREEPPVRVASAPISKPRASTLRLKPLSDLRLDDFKINPAANKGHDFAFSEVVRDKDDRVHLRGCTDMHCCGKQWRAMALSQRPDPPLTTAQRHDEQKLLETYLGDYSYRLASMTQEEKAELWLEAKTEELANRFGKHRHNYSRMQSPPGFWNADFPDTQQLVAEKQEAEKRERQAIAERHREAMRPGGRWLFRDE